MSRPAVFVDRDGTLTREGDWITHPGALELVPFAAEALAELRREGYLIVLYSNQSAVARGMITEEELARIHEHLQEMLAERGARLDAIYSCPHHPTEGLGRYRVDCACRKPKPGLLLDARRDLGIDFSRSWCVGDMERDLQAGAAVGVPGILVATGKGQREHARMLAEGRPAAEFVPDLPAAARRIAASISR